VGEGRVGSTGRRVQNCQKVQVTRELWGERQNPSSKGMFIFRGSCPYLQGPVSVIKT